MGYYKEKANINGYRRNKVTQVFVDGFQITPERSRKLLDISDTFEWGNGGQAAGQLAFAILLEIAGEKIARSHWESFKWFFLQPLLPGEDFKIVFNFGNWLRIKDEVSYNEWRQMTPLDRP